jgi:predicted CopG family antitoxin
MSSKLTLSMDSDIITLAKELAMHENKSLSSLVRELILERKIESIRMRALQSFTDMQGVVDGSHLSDEDLEKIKLEHLKKKHG